MQENDELKGKDAFWDLESLLPAREKKRRVESVSRDTEAVTVTVAPSTLAGVAAADSLFVEHYVHPYALDREKKEEPLFAYAPQNTLLREVRVYPWETEYDHYEQFYRHAHRFAACEGKEAPFVEFFAYVPQYAQMNTAQLNYYFWWRRSFHEGRCLPASYSYLLLYLFEIINLGEAIEPGVGQERMLRLWLSYRTEHPRLDALVREWLVDYSLLHKLPPPTLPQSMYRDLLSGGKLKEFFVSPGEGDDAMTTAVLLFCNNYDYTKSKFCTEQTIADYHRVLRGAVRETLAYLRERDGEFLVGTSGVSTVKRDAFVGSVCSYRERRRIEVDYTSFSRTHELRYLMSDVLKYAENALRARRGIKSRLSIYAVDTALRERLDAYLESALPPRPQKAKKEQKAEEIPAYEKRYDLPVRAPSPTRAAEIENASWQTTKRLIEAFEEVQNEEKVANGIEKVPEAPISAPPAPTQSEPTLGEDTLVGTLGELASFLALTGARAQREFALSRGMMVDAIVDKINTVAGDILGDILLEEGDDGYAVIEDYREILIEEGILNDGK